MTWATVAVLVPIMVAGFGLLWWEAERHRRDLVSLRAGVRSEIAATRAALGQPFSP